MKKVNLYTTCAILSLLMMLILMLFSSAGDSATMDELAHIPAGFGYVIQHDYRLNPEHPPLIKALSAYSAWILAKPYFPTNTPYWKDHINGQWDQGRVFLYESGNDADKIIFWSRFPLILLTVFLGALIFWWTRKKFGEVTALITLIFYTFSPTFLAHGRYVTTDLGATFGFFLGLIAFLKFIEKPVWKNTILSGLALGLVLLLKFSLILLLPVFLTVIIAKIWLIKAYSGSDTTPQNHSNILKNIGMIILLGLAALVLVWAVYYFFNYNYPRDKQLADANFILNSFPNKALAKIDLWMIGQPGLRHLGQYILGFLMVGQRAGGGNTGYFLGEVSAGGWRYYFPVIYLFKETLALHILTLLVILNVVKNLICAKLSLAQMRGKLSLAQAWLQNHLTEFSFLVFIAVYWTSSIISPLNIGVRHVLPTFPFIYILVSKQITKWVISCRGRITHIASGRLLCGLLVILFVWLVGGTILSYPHFLSYYNELAGGANNGYKIAVDSNYDWGQDLKRLKKIVDDNKIEKIAVDYFGGGSPRYYLGDRFEPWWSAKGTPSADGPKWLAVSATFRQGAFGAPVPGFERKPEDSYLWLKEYEPVARAGKSIFIYRLPLVPN